MRCHHGGSRKGRRHVAHFPRVHVDNLTHIFHHELALPDSARSLDPPALLLCQEDLHGWIAVFQVCGQLSIQASVPTRTCRQLALLLFGSVLAPVIAPTRLNGAFTRRDVTYGQHFPSLAEVNRSPDAHIWWRFQVSAGNYSLLPHSCHYFI
eukprot:scaffold197568_cov31-Tisochrysis_lutea.AAC.3